MTPQTIQSMEFSRPEYCSGQPFPSAGDPPNPGTEPRSPALQADSLPSERLREAQYIYISIYLSSLSDLVHSVQQKLTQHCKATIPRSIKEKEE